MSKSLIYVAVDNEMQNFHTSNVPVAVIRAARGTSKSTACQMQLYAESQWMPPQADGVRRSAWLITRTSYRDLEQSAVKSYIERFQGVPGMLPISGREPWTGGIRMNLKDGTRVESDWLFMAVPPDDLGKLGSMQFTGAYINELMDFPNAEIVTAIMGSCGRYPSKDGFSAEYISARDGKSLYRSRLICDTNGPYESHWIRGYEDKPPATWEFFIQQPPLLRSDIPVEGALEYRGKYYYPNPKCTYAHIQPKGFQYWLDLVPGSDDWYIESRILGEYSKSISGKRVYPNFNESMVVKQELDLSAFRGERIIVGIDTSGNHPAAVVTCMHDGALYVLDEIGDEHIAFDKFVSDYLIPLLAAKYIEHDIIAVLDPSNPQSGLDKRTALGVCIAAGLDARLAPTNFFRDRVNAVKYHMDRRDGFYIYPDAHHVLEGFRGHYHFPEVRGRQGVYKEAPNKEVVHADYHDALQYAALGYKYTRQGNGEKAHIKKKQKRAV